MEERPLQEYPNTNLTRCEELWFEDGNIVIQAQNTLFKVHRSILRAQSSVFADIFNSSQSAKQDELYEDCPLVQLDDSAEELVLFLKGVFDSSTFSSQDKPTFLQVMAFARLGTKYNIRHIRAYGLRILRQAYPLSLDEFDASQAIRPFTSVGGNIVIVINLARELVILDILPAAFVYASVGPLSRIMHGTTDDVQLSEIDKFSCIVGRDSLFRSTARVHGFLTSPAQCASVAFCNIVRLQCLKLIMEGPLHPLMGGIRAGLCTECTREWKRTLGENRRELWSEIPKMFNLPSWDVLREVRERDEMESTKVA